MASLETTLNENGLGKWHATFEAEEITLDNIADMTSDDLKELGLPMGARKDVLKLFSGSDKEPAKPQKAAANKTPAKEAAEPPKKKAKTGLFAAMNDSSSSSDDEEDEEGGQGDDGSAAAWAAVAALEAKASPKPPAADSSSSDASDSESDSSGDDDDDDDDDDDEDEEKETAKPAGKHSDDISDLVSKAKARAAAKTPGRALQQSSLADKAKLQSAIDSSQSANTSGSISSGSAMQAQMDNARAQAAIGPAYKEKMLEELSRSKLLPAEVKSSVPFWAPLEIQAAHDLSVGLWQAHGSSSGLQMHCRKRGGKGNVWELSVCTKGEFFFVTVARVIAEMVVGTIAVLHQVCLRARGVCMLCV
jgi:hypothetical protein